jgi:HNH endonuclease
MMSRRKRDRQGLPNKRQPSPLFKPAARIVDPGATQKKLLRDRECRGCGSPASEGHHILFRSGRGDDVPDNIVPLCDVCHAIVHRGGGHPRQFTVWRQATKAEVNHIVVRIGRSFTREEILYVLDKLGDSPGREYLSRRYSLGSKEIRKQLGG